MPDMNKILFIRAKRCDECNPAETCDSCLQGYNALAHVEQHAQGGGWTIFDAADENANKEYVYNTIDQNDPGVIYGFGHGNECYSEDTEILTEDGWKYFYDLKEERVATLNKETGELEYHKPIRKMMYDYKGEMFYHKGKVVDLLVTPNHNLYVSWQTDQGKRYSNFQFIQPTDIKNGKNKGRLRFKRDAVWKGIDDEFFILPSITHNHKNQYSDKTYEKKIPEKKINMDDWLEFFGWWISEGCACLGFADKDKKYINYRVSITQNNNDKREKIKNVIEKIGYKYRETGNSHSMNLEIRDKQLYEYLKQFGRSGDKFIPKEIKQLSSRQLKILFDALILGDGTKYINSYVYGTKSKRLADDVQEIALKIGYAGSITRDERGLYRISIATNANLNPLCRKFRGFIEYEGVVYCVEVPNNVIYVRRNGKPIWCGNSRYTAQHRQDVFNTTECDKVNGKIIYLLSCLTGNLLGPMMMQKGAVAYAGFNISWTWVAETDVNDNFLYVDPYQDKYAKCFYESANELMVALCNGQSFIEAVHASVLKYNEWIQYWYDVAPGDPASQDCIMWLAHDRDGLVALTYCDYITTEQACLDADCYWKNGKCQSTGDGGHVPLQMVALLPVMLVVGMVFIAFKK